MLSSGDEMATKSHIIIIFIIIALDNECDTFVAPKSSLPSIKCRTALVGYI